MPILAAIGLLAQIFFAVHCIRTGRDRYWIYIIILFPGIGSLIYFLAEFLPDFQQSPEFRKTGAQIGKIVNPGKELQKLKDQLEISDSVKNKKALAEYYVNSGRFDQAISLFKNCLEGVHADDPFIYEGLCCAYFFSGDYEQAKKHFTTLKGLRKDDKITQFDLLYAQTLEKLSDVDGALEEYARLSKSLPGEEARCRYGALLKQVGKTDEAKDVFQEVVKNVRLSPKYYRKTQKRWVTMAKKELAS